MADVVPLTASKALEDYIKVLGLRGFPCGTGSWHETCDHLKPIKKEHLKPGPVSSCLDADDSKKETSENLVELITSSYSPWYLDYSWSKEAKGLREIAVKTPQLINADFVFSYFRTLKIVDKAVTEIDKGLVRLKNLEELTLSANYITSVNSKCLPSKLKVLELYANNIQCISDLCCKPPPLEHLGLGRNRISDVVDYISGDYWPYLVSLDLSHNDLTGLIDIVATLCSLPQLRNLLLQGNPISLIPGYRGYIIDCLQDLTVLDDRHISIDEKNHFKGVAEWTEYILEEAIVQLGVMHIKGLPCPAEVMYPNDQPDFPVIEKCYFVQFTFPAQFYGKLQETEMQVVNKSSVSEITSLTERQENETDKAKLQARSNQSIQVNEQTRPDKDIVRTSVQTITPEPQKIKSTKSTAIKIEQTNGTPYSKLVTINSHYRQWEEEIILNWTTDLIQSDLLFLRDFLKTGMDVAIVEQTIESYPAENPTESKVEKTAESKEKDQKDKKKNKTQRKETITKPARKDQVKEKGKKKKLSVEGLVRGPPKLTNVASFHMPLDNLLNGEYECRTTFTKIFDVPQRSGSNKALDDVADDKNKYKKRTSIKPNQDKKTDVGKSPNNKDDKKRIKKKSSTDGEEEEDLTCIPLELELCVKLHHWLTVTDKCQEVKQRHSLKEMATHTE